MTIEEMIGRAVREEMQGRSPAVEFAELTKVDNANPGLFPMDDDFMNPTYSQDDSLESFLRGYSTEELRKLGGKAYMAPARSEVGHDMGGGESFGSEKASRPGMVKLTKRFIAETGEVMIEGWDSQGRCTSTRFIPASEIDEGEPLLNSANTGAISNQASHWEKACADTAKAAIAELERVRSSVLEPPVISRVTPTPPGVTAVPRAGQKPLQKNIDSEFAWLVGSGDERKQ